jgi:hypothetical protein
MKRLSLHLASGLGLLLFALEFRGYRGPAHAHRAHALLGPQQNDCSSFALRHG